MQRVSNFQLGGPEKISGADDPRHALQENEGLADPCSLVMVTSFVIRYWCRLTCMNSMTPTTRAKSAENRKLSIMLRTWTQPHLSGKLTTCGNWPLSPQQPLEGPHLGPRQFIADQLLAKTEVIRAMHERVQLCQQTEFALLRECLGVSRIDHVLRVHGHTVLQEKRAALGAGQSGIGYKRSRHTATPAHLGAVTAAKPRIQAVIRGAVVAGLLP